MYNLIFLLHCNLETHVKEYMRMLHILNLRNRYMNSFLTKPIPNCKYLVKPFTKVFMKVFHEIYTVWFIFCTLLSSAIWRPVFDNTSNIILFFQWRNTSIHDICRFLSTGKNLGSIFFPHKMYNLFTKSFPLGHQ